MGLMGTLATWVAKTEFSQVINITWTNWDIIQSFEQKREDLDVFLLTNRWYVEKYTIMDRNLWASKASTWCSTTDTSSCWWYYYLEFNEDGKRHCPSWYEIPLNERETLVKNRKISNGRANTDVWIWNLFSSDLLLPFAWYKTNKNSNITGRNEWVYWTIDEDVVQDNYFTVKLNIRFNNISVWHHKRSYIPVRCFKSSYNRNHNVYANWWNTAIITIHWNKILTLTNPINSRWSFVWWFNSRIWWNEIHEWENAPSNLYARWNCYEWYEQDTRWDCIPKKYNIMYELYEWINSINNTWAYTIETNTINLADATKNWYNFDGWFSEAEYTNQITEIKKWTTWDITLYAKWTPEEYAINYIINDWVLSWKNVTWYTIESDEITLINPTKTWYSFTWRSGTDIDGFSWNVVIPSWSTWDRNYEANWQINQYTITFDTNWWSEIEPITADYWTWITAPTNPTKNGYKFVGWDKEIPATMPAENLTIKAVWEKLWSSGWWGGRSNKTSDTQDSTTQNDKNTENVIQSETKWSEESSTTPMDSSDKSSEWQSYSPEFQQAYEFAKEKWITTMPTIQEAQMNWKLTRIAMAKMLSQYAMNVLWQKPANIVTPKFNDVSDKQNSDYDDWVTLAYQLWIMWQNMPNNKFRPDDEVTRAEFATALSRMLYHTSDWQYKSTDKYYTNHMKKLVQEWIITNDDAKMKELRWYVMIMLMRSAK